MKYILFVCTHNAGRSQMAQAFWRKHAPPDVRAESAGQEPAKAPWPEVVQVMRDVGIDISNERPKKLDLEMQLHADWAITLGCGGSCPYVPTMVEDWQIPDPAGLSLEETRPIRDLLEEKVRDLVEVRLEAIRHCADLMLQPYDDATVRSYVLALATKNARECLREGRCAVA